MVGGEGWGVGCKEVRGGDSGEGIKGWGLVGRGSGGWRVGGWHRSLHVAAINAHTETVLALHAAGLKDPAYLPHQPGTRRFPEPA